MSSEPRYWLAAASREHVLRGVFGGFYQICHGKAAPLRRMAVGDGVMYYPSKVCINEPEPCQRFIAIGQTAGEDIEQAQASERFRPFRRPACCFPCEEASILPFIAALSLIRDKKRWGLPFRFGLLEIPQADLQRIAEAMRAPVPEATPGEF